MDVKFVIKIRWNCGTERYVTGYGDGRTVKWEPEKTAMIINSFESADDLCRGLNFNHLSGDLGGFACVVAIDPKRAEEYVNPDIEDEEDGENWRLLKLQQACAKHRN